MQAGYFAEPPFERATGLEFDAIMAEAQEVFVDPALWLNTPNANLGGESPLTLMESDRAPVVLNLLRLIRYVGTT